MRKSIVVLVAGLALLAACSTKSSGGSAGGTSGSAATDTRAVGVTATTIKIGITYVDLKAIQNLISTDDGDFPTSYKAVINQINANGGINGRKIVPYIVGVNPTIATGGAEACTKLTEDDKVFAVIGAYFADNDALCYTKTHDTPVVGAALTPAQQKVSTAPWFSDSLTAPSLIVKELAEFQKEGVFTGHKVAIVGQGQSAQGEISTVVAPELRKLGVNVVDTAVNDASTNDPPAYYGRYKVLAQKFQTDGADVVVTDGGANQSWPQALQISQLKYFPRDVGLDYNVLNVYLTGGSVPDAAVLRDAVAGSGSMPDAALVWNQPAVQSCVSTVTAAHPYEPINNPVTANSKTKNTWVSALDACQITGLFAAIAKAAGPTLTNATFAKGGESLTNLSLPGSTQPLHFSSTVHDGDLPVTVWKFNTAAIKFDPKIVPSS